MKMMDTKGEQILGKWSRDEAIVSPLEDESILAEMAKRADETVRNKFFTLAAEVMKSPVRNAIRWETMCLCETLFENGISPDARDLADFILSAADDAYHLVSVGLRRCFEKLRMPRYNDLRAQVRIILETRLTKDEEEWVRSAGKKRLQELSPIRQEVKNELRKEVGRFIREARAKLHNFDALPKKQQEEKKEERDLLLYNMRNKFLWYLPELRKRLATLDNQMRFLEGLQRRITVLPEILKRIQ